MTTLYPHCRIPPDVWSLIATAASWLLGLVFPSRKDPSAEQLAASNATAQTELASQEGANEIVTKAVAASNVDTALQLRGDNGPNELVNTASGAPVNTDPNAHFRD